MSFFKNFLTNKSFDAPLESKVSGLSRETVESNVGNRSQSSYTLEDLPSSSRTKTAQEEKKYLNLHIHELNVENEGLKDKI